MIWSIVEPPPLILFEFVSLARSVFFDPVSCTICNVLFSLVTRSPIKAIRARQITNWLCSQTNLTKNLFDLSALRIDTKPLSETWLSERFKLYRLLFLFKIWAIMWHPPFFSKFELRFSFDRLFESSRDPDKSLRPSTFRRTPTSFKDFKRKFWTI